VKNLYTKWLRNTIENDEIFVLFVHASAAWYMQVYMLTQTNEKNASKIFFF
jgi:hypothetical protein